MKTETREWVAKAEEDFVVAQRLVRWKKRQVSDAVCFHCQQCVEKYLKAHMVEAGVPFPKIHHLPALLDLAVTVEPLWEPFRPAMISLKNYAVAFRYPGESANEAEAHKAVAACKSFRAEARRTLGL